MIVVPRLERQGIVHDAMGGVNDSGVTAEYA